MTKKKIAGLLVVLVFGVVLAGCTDKETVVDTTDSDVENVTVIEPDDKDDNVLAEDEVDKEELTDVADEVEEDVQDEEEPVDEVVEATVDEDGKKTVGTSTSADNAAIIGYSYEINSGMFIFKWKVRATEEEPYPVAVAFGDSSNKLTVEFTSLVKDYVAKEESSTDLGSLLPTLNWMPTTNGSKYEFEYEEAKDFTLKTIDEGDDGQFIILEVEL